MSETKPEIRTEMRGRALWITIDREERRNAINKAVIAGIEAAVTVAQSDPAIRAIVLTGAGRKAFCAGADLTGGTGTFILGLDEPMTDFGRLARLIRLVGAPIIGRIMMRVNVLLLLCNRLRVQEQLRLHPEILATPGAALVGALPKELELATVYSVGVCTKATQSGLARQFAAMLTEEASRDLRLRLGFHC